MATTESNCIMWFCNISRRVPVLVEIAGAAAYALLFCHRDLHVIDVVAIPDGLHQAVGKAKHQQILHRFLTQIMIDAEDLLFFKVTVQMLIELSSRLQIGAKRLFHHDTISKEASTESRRVELAHYLGKIGRRDRQIKHDVGTHALARLAQFHPSAGCSAPVGHVPLSHS